MCKKLSLAYAFIKILFPASSDMNVQVVSTQEVETLQFPCNKKSCRSSEFERRSENAILSNVNLRTLSIYDLAVPLTHELLKSKNP